MSVHFPKTLESKLLKKSTDVSLIARDGSGSPQWWGARRRRQGTIRKYFINRTEIVTAATTPGCTIEVTSNHIDVLRDHKRTNGLDNFLGNTSFLGVDIVDVS